MSRPKRQALFFAANTIPLIICLALIVACVTVARVTPFWFDEILTYYPVTMASFARILPVSREPMNTSPPLYFYVIWLYTHLFGATPLALRLFSSLNFCGAVLLLWRLLRPRVSAAAATVALICIIASSSVIYYNSQARFYGLYFFFAALLFYVFVQSNENRRATGKGSHLREAAAVGLVSLLLLFTHTLGIFFVASLLLSQLILDGIEARKSGSRVWSVCRPGVYAGALVALLVFGALWLPTALAQQRAFHGASNLEAASPRLFLDILFDEEPLRKLLYSLPILLLFFIVTQRRQQAGAVFATPDLSASPAARSALLPLVTLAVGYQVIAPLLFYLASVATSSLLSQRYAMPHWIGWAVLGAVIIDAGIKQGRASQKYLSYGVCAALLLIAVPKFVNMARHMVADGKTSTQNLAILKGATEKFSRTRDAGIANHSASLPVLWSGGMLFSQMYFYYPETKPMFLLHRIAPVGINGVLHTNVEGLHHNYPLLPILDEGQIAGYREFVFYQARTDDITVDYFTKNGEYTSEALGEIPQFAPNGKRVEWAVIDVYRLRRSK